METSVSLLERLAGAPSDDDWQRLDDLYRPLLRAWLVRAGVVASDVEDLVQDVLHLPQDRRVRAARQGGVPGLAAADRGKPDARLLPQAEEPADRHRRQ
jgi:hypothetical protein